MPPFCLYVYEGRGGGMPVVQTEIVKDTDEFKALGLLAFRTKNNDLKA